jgi:hypothetical protein
MQHTADGHHQSADTLPPPVERVFDDAIAPDTPVAMLEPPAGALLLYGFLLQRQCLVARFFGGHEDLHGAARATLKLEIVL